MRFRGTAAAIGVAAGMAGCASLLAIDSVDYAALDASNADVLGIDAADVTSAADATDGATADDQPPDAPRFDGGWACPPTDSGALPFCADFNRDPYSQNWTRLDNGTDAAIFRWLDAAVSPPSSVMFASSTPGAYAVALVRDFSSPAAPQTFSLEFDLWVESAIGDPTAELAHLTFGAAQQPFFQLQVTLSGNGAGLRVDLFDGSRKAYPPNIVLLTVTPRAWQHVRLAGTLAPLTVQLSLDGLTSDVGIGADSGIAVQRRVPQISVGLPHLTLIDGGNDYRVALDDVLFDCR
jgi:hypothetical protein